ncbi:hypothetical protein PUNSTDRAFT_137199 [Punctularia strigosozonata HHB-11173 SS5]|uniref:uncharacterized protein n=1 Tax=Punctularia strigosozonata (strain HHB-11173) TaxID=741275 RepID=UPI0004417796|nr:uncharacterized protein PUNSTDRAFT_137199 [Punctularia strigosozonata HHB-11173 SS5]EIN05708.1 hypothetical protein PUNSTDRAFT_137199 [Punctularia strigosozonata HHB-11173 SS5]
MFKSFTRSLPQVSIFHNPSSPPSVKALQILQAALSNPYPPHSKDGKPLEFDLQVVERPPTSDQITTLLTHYNLGGSSTANGGLSTFLSSHPAGAGSPTPTSNACAWLYMNRTPDALVKTASSTPSALKWPIVVDWTNGKAVVGESEGVKSILDEIKKKQEGS